MQENVVDIIVSIYRRLIAGEILTEIKSDDFPNFKKSEFLAAYSYILEKKEGVQDTSPVMPRILHLAERMVIAPDAYGFLLELNKLRVLSPGDIEHLIEKTMINSTSRVTLDMMKALVANHLFQFKNSSQGLPLHLSGNEMIN
jgi:uncharacterized protein Smg (DUF494 family)